MELLSVMKSHGFDDSGARYNADGNLIDWWTEGDLTRFTALGTALADQYSALDPSVFM
jgi:endothelin-converting enzyme/putative endopeptidase